MTLPNDVPTTAIQGTYSISEADNADSGTEPQGAPLDGLQIVLTPEPARVWTHTSSGAGIAIGPMLATTNSMGVVTNPVTGLVGLRIPSSTQTGLTGAPTIPWTVEVSDPLGRFETERKTFHAPPGGSIQLPTVAPFWPDPNAGTIPQWENARAEAHAAIDTYAPGAVQALLTGKLKWGKGSPEGRVVASVGTLYIDEDGTMGATLWAKQKLDNSWGWRVAYGETHWIDITAEVLAMPDVNSVSSAAINRVGSDVYLTVQNLQFKASGHLDFWSPRFGYRPASTGAFRSGTLSEITGANARIVSPLAQTSIRLLSANGGTSYNGFASWPSADTWPAS